MRRLANRIMQISQMTPRQHRAYLKARACHARAEKVLRRHGPCRRWKHHMGEYYDWCLISSGMEPRRLTCRN